jgi:hypothetical protein
LGVDPLDRALGIALGCRQSRERIALDEKFRRNGRSYLGLCRLDGVNAGDVNNFQVGICRVDCPLGDDIASDAVAVQSLQFAGQIVRIVRFIVFVFPSIGQFFLVIAVFHGLVFGGDGDFSLGDRQLCRIHFDVVVVGDNFPIAVLDFTCSGDGIRAYKEIVETVRLILERIRHRQRIAIIQLRAFRQFIFK